jgi:hypothetical protein
VQLFVLSFLCFLSLGLVFCDEQVHYSAAFTAVNSVTHFQRENVHTFQWFSQIASEFQNQLEGHIILLNIKLLYRLFFC